MHHCDDHDGFHETLTQVATNTAWIISALKMGATVAGAVVTVIVIPASIWFISLDKRITNLESKAAYYVKK